MERYSIQKVIKVVKCCVVLHNLCLKSVNSVDIEKSPRPEPTFNACCRKEGIVEGYRLHLQRYRESRSPEWVARNVTLSSFNTPIISFKMTFLLLMF